jgi:hypothetical protein
MNGGVPLGVGRLIDAEGLLDAGRLSDAGALLEGLLDAGALLDDGGLSGLQEYSDARGLLDVA